MILLKKLRVLKRIPQAELARILSVDQTAVSQWERGKSMPRAERLTDIAQALGCTVDELLGRVNR